MGYTDSGLEWITLGPHPGEAELEEIGPVIQGDETKGMTCTGDELESTTSGQYSDGPAL